MSIFQEMRSRARRSLAPATVAICCALVISFLLSLFNFAPQFISGLVFLTDFSRPWALVTYPFAMAAGIVWLIFEVLWVWWIGGSIERELDTPKYMTIWLAFTVLGALCVAVGAVWLPGTLSVFGPMIPVGALSVIWGTRNPSATVMLGFFLPIQGRWLAWLTAAIVFFNMSSITGNMTVGLLACVPLVAAYLFAANRIPFMAYSRGPAGGDWGFRKRTAADSPVARKTERMGQEYYDDVRRREREREERERLRKLFEGSAEEGDK